MNTIDLRPLLSKYSSGWIAVSDDYNHVVAHSDNFIDLQKKIQKIKDKVVVVQAFKNYYNYVS